MRRYSSDLEVFLRCGAFLRLCWNVTKRSSHVCGLSWLEGGTCLPAASHRFNRLLDKRLARPRGYPCVTLPWPILWEVQGPGHSTQAVPERLPEHRGGVPGGDRRAFRGRCDVAELDNDSVEQSVVLRCSRVVGGVPPRTCRGLFCGNISALIPVHACFWNPFFPCMGCQ